MGIFEEIKRMQEEGKSDQDMILLLQESGYGIKEASDAVAQARIKEAVSSQEGPAVIPQYPNQDQEMMQSIVNQPQQMSKPPTQQLQPEEQYQEQYQQEQQPEQQEQMPQQQYQEQYANTNADYSQQYQQQQQYPSYDPSNSSADIMTEIAEQIVSEKISSLRKQIEVIIDLKNSNEAKLISMDDRLKRLEKTIDRIQLSILQKVGEYLTNVEDIKKEMIENQKSFKTLIGSKGHK